MATGMRKGFGDGGSDILMARREIYETPQGLRDTGSNETVAFSGFKERDERRCNMKVATLEKDVFSIREVMANLSERMKNLEKKNADLNDKLKYFECEIE
ncbi:hypothetical protein E2C01_070072 [Portunus trituberculatus]|uniref:Uncharacterized protein n=1 Tax=Portunus trituberculatus TaxID=210409 RepID=A0A5B7I1A5_PORTR|nr:hypothetical protein [Portunus trituberculatus]